jgi:oligosaccharyltransferase complex subunit beta
MAAAALRLIVGITVAATVVALCSAESPLAPVGQRVLVLLDDLSFQANYSRVLDSLKKRYDLTIAKTALAPPLQKYGEWSFDHLISFASSYEFDKTIKTSDVVEFIDSGRNLVLAVSGVSEGARDMLEEFDISLGGLPVVVDHSHPLSSDHATVSSANWDSFYVSHASASSVLPPPAGPVAYRGSALGVSVDSPLVVPVLRAHHTAYCRGADDDEEQETSIRGSDIVLAALFQARNNHARAFFLGSADFCSDAFFSTVIPGADGKPTKAGNQAVCEALISWTMHERGHLRLHDGKYAKVSGVPMPEDQKDVITIKDQVLVSTVIEEWDGKARQWIPFTQPDVQLEVTMLDPHIRQRFTEVSPSGTYTATIKMPDRYGIFTLRVDYKRFGYTTLLWEERFPVRPFRHNQYERFIPSAFPFYAGALSMLLGFGVFSFLFLYHQDPQKTARKTD